MREHVEPVVRMRSPAEREQRRALQLLEEQAVVEGILWGMLPVTGEFHVDDVWQELRQQGVQLRRWMAVSLAVRQFVRLRLIEATGEKRFVTDWRGHSRYVLVYSTLGSHRVSDELCRWQKAMALAEWFGEEKAQ